MTRTALFAPVPDALVDYFEEGVMRSARAWARVERVPVLLLALLGGLAIMVSVHQFHTDQSMAMATGLAGLLCCLPLTWCMAQIFLYCTLSWIGGLILVSWHVPSVAAGHFRDDRVLGLIIAILVSPVLLITLVDITDRLWRASFNAVKS